jgi:demethylmenaquinone methyltransferase/2-methoxy-6-polyprenyl-1,4-benzoquinol methylase
MADLDGRMSDQIAYYRARAGEYDATSVSDIETASAWFSDLLDELAPRGAVLEIACGTGLWTQHLVERADRVTALDSSPEMIELARSRAGEPAPEFVAADVFEWEPQRRYDSIFFGFWLSHVPPERFATFWRLLGTWLVPKGRVLFVDEGAPRASGDTPVESGSDPLSERRLRDGTRYEIVKVFHDRDELTHQLADLGWSANVRLSGDGFLVGSAQGLAQPVDRLFRPPLDEPPPDRPVE